MVQRNSVLKEGLSDHVDVESVFGRGRGCDIRVCKCVCGSIIRWGSTGLSGDAGRDKDMVWLGGVGGEGVMVVVIYEVDAKLELKIALLVKSFSVSASTT